MISFYLAKWRGDEAKLSSFSLPKSALYGDLADQNVAIIGNARALSQTTLGPRIDQADVVIRLNSAPISSVESHGAKTDWIAISTPISQAILQERLPSRILWMTRRRKRIPYRLASDSRFYLSARSDWNGLYDRLGSAPTTGLMVIDFVAHTAAQTIELYGFDFFSSKSLSGRRDSKQVPHDFGLERAFVFGLVKEDRRVRLVPMDG